MVVESFQSFLPWLGSAILPFFLIVVAVAIVGLFLSYLFTAFRHGPQEAYYVISKVLSETGPDFFRTSPRRIFTIAGLAIKEALRRRVILISFVIFALSLLFGGWFLNSGSEHPDRVYVNFVFWGTQLLILLLALLISAFSLPEDIRNRTIYTVVTKPVRATEIVLGRIIGFSVIGSVMLLAMGVISLLFVWRGLSHTHTLDSGTQTTSAFAAVDSQASGRRGSENAVGQVDSTVISGHRHRVEELRDVRLSSEPPPTNNAAVLGVDEQNDRNIYSRVHVHSESGHTHGVRVEKSADGDSRIVLGGPKGLFRVRIPVYAERIIFFDQTGRERTEGGLNVGNLWTYRGYIAGGSNLSRASFEFEDFTTDRFNNLDIIPLELTLQVFRSHKGNIERQVEISIQFESIPDDETGNHIVTEEMNFESAEFEIQVKGIPRKLPGQVVSADGQIVSTGTYDLFDDLASNGRVRLNLRCVDGGQYVGVAQADVYFRAADGIYWANFLTGYLGIWLQMLMVVTLAVAFSTFLSAPVTMLATIVTIVIGYFSPVIRAWINPATAEERAYSIYEGGGPIEALYRLITQKNTQVPLEEGPGTWIVKNVDRLWVEMLDSLTYMVPSFAEMDYSDYLIYGYYIDHDRLFIAATITFAFCIGVYVVGYFSMKTREIAG